MGRMSNDSAEDKLDVDRLLASGLVKRVAHFDSLGSTHDFAHEEARRPGVELPLLVLAEEQTAGRGRGHNRWWTGRGSVAMSLLLDPADWELHGELPPQRSLAVGVAIVDTLSLLLPQRRVGLHWPNDVFVEGRKIAGVLVDVLADGRHVIGIGLNVNHSFADAPEEVKARATSLFDLAGKRFDRTQLVCELLAQLRSSLQAAAASPESYGRRFDELCLQRGETITINAAGRQTSGRCAGIAPDGALLLETPAGVQKFYSGVLVH